MMFEVLWEIQQPRVPVRREVPDLHTQPNTVGGIAHVGGFSGQWCKGRSIGTDGALGRHGPVLINVIRNITGKLWRFRRTDQVKDSILGQHLTAKQGKDYYY